MPSSNNAQRDARPPFSPRSSPAQEKEFAPQNYSAPRLCNLRFFPHELSPKQKVQTWNISGGFVLKGRLRFTAPIPPE